MGWREFVRDPFVLLTLLIHLAVAAVSVFPVLSPTARTLFLEGYVLIPITLLGILAPWVGLGPFRDRRERLFWGLWSLSLGFHLVIRWVYLLVPDVNDGIRGAFAIDLLYVLFFLPLILSVLVRPDRPRGKGRGGAARGLEFAGTGILTLALIGYFLLIPRFMNPEEYLTWVPSLLMFWVLDAFLLLSLFYLRETALTQEWRILYSWLALAPACWVITEFLELAFHLTLGDTIWPITPADVLWYLPWMAIIFAGRMRVSPLPAILGAGHQDPLRSEVSRSLGRPGWLQVAALVLPLVHIGFNLLNLLDPETRNIRELLVLVTLVLLLGLAYLHQKLLEGRALALTRRSRELEERQRMLAAAVEQSPDAVLIADGMGVVRYGNRAFSALEGGLDRVLDAPLLKALPQGIEGMAEGRLGKELGEALARGRPWEGRTPPGARGEEGEELVTISPVRGVGGEVEHWVMIRRDVTYLSQLERQFRQTQRMEAMGAFAGGMARHFKGLLREIHGHGESLRGELSPTSPASRDVAQLLSATERATEMVSRVLAFSQEGAEGKEILSLGGVVGEGLSLIRANLPVNVELASRMEEGVCPIRGVRTELRQILLNLSDNALQALEPHGGRLEVKVTGVVLGQEESDGLRLPGPGDYACLSVRDTGRGMDRATLSRVFDAFFTTKGIGAGTGLGLYLVRETVLDHGGGVRVQSEPGWGTLFHLYFPCVSSDGAGERESR